MNNLAQALWVESLKALRSKMPLLTLLATALMPLAGGFFMIILRDPELARRSGLISAKANIAMGTADWPAYLAFLSMAVSAAGLILFGFIISWVIGREFVDRTAKDLLALPTPRTAIVLAKFLVVAVWSAVLVVWMYAVGLAVGAAIGLPQPPPGAMEAGSVPYAVAALLTIILATTIGFIASAGHGYLPPLGFMILAMGFAQGFAVAGYGEYFPWAIPALYAQGDEVGPVSYAIVLLTGAAGFLGTLAWWQRADQSR